MAVGSTSTVSSAALHPSPVFRIALSVAALALVSAVLDVLGVAGYRYGASIVTAALALGGAALAWLVSSRRWAAVAVAMLGIIAGGVLAARAPWSSGRLEAALDDLDNLQGFTVLDTDREGHSWCRPDCPSVVRTWDAPNTAPRAAVFLMALSLSEAGLAPPYDELPADSLRDHLVVHGSETDALVTAERLGPRTLHVTVVLSSHR